MVAGWISADEHQEHPFLIADTFCRGVTRGGLTKQKGISVIPRGGQAKADMALSHPSFSSKLSSGGK